MTADKSVIVIKEYDPERRDRIFLAHWADGRIKIRPSDIDFDFQ
jgi:hypothetical protein